jgi:long-chain acyl-CoA synthetase
LYEGRWTSRTVVNDLLEPDQLKTLSNNLGALLAGAAQRFGHDELIAGARAVCAKLAEAGLAAREPVHVRVSNRMADLAAYLGVWLAGGVVVPVHRSSPEGAIRHILAKTRARFEWDDSLQRLLDQAPSSRPILDDAALIVFTSGSSGMPKGAVLSHRAFAGKLAAIQSLLRFQPDECTLLVLNITFSFGIWVALLTLLHGGRLAMCERFSAKTFLEELQRQEITRVAVVPTMMRSLILDVPRERLEAQGRALGAAGTLRQVLIGGETLGKALGETLRGLFAPAELIDIYGLTETSTCDFFLMPSDAGRYAGCIGRPSPGVRYRIAEDGELWIASPYLMNGYLDEPGLEPIRDGWLATGDLARERDPGVVEIGGRKKELIYRGGNKVAPQEIEFACSAHPGVAAALAIGRADERLGQRIHALIVPRDPQLRPAELRAFLAGRLERYKQPDVLYFAATLPAGRTGKADRGRFAAMLDGGELKPVEEL